MHDFLELRFLTDNYSHDMSTKDNVCCMHMHNGHSQWAWLQLPAICDTYRPCMPLDWSQFFVLIQLIHCAYEAHYDSKIVPFLCLHYDAGQRPNRLLYPLAHTRGVIMCKMCVCVCVCVCVCCHKHAGCHSCQSLNQLHMLLGNWNIARDTLGYLVIGLMPVASRKYAGSKLYIIWCRVVVRCVHTASQGMHYSFIARFANRIPFPIGQSL